jgi:hypothetical protein
MVGGRPGGLLIGLPLTAAKARQAAAKKAVAGWFGMPARSTFGIGSLLPRQRKGPSPKARPFPV